MEYGILVAVERDWLPLLLSAIAAIAAVGAAVLYAVFSHRLVRIQRSFNSWTQSLKDPDPLPVGAVAYLRKDISRLDHTIYEQSTLSDSRELYSEGALFDFEYPSEPKTRKREGAGFQLHLHMSNPGDMPIYEGGSVRVRDRSTGRSVIGRRDWAHKKRFEIPPHCIRTARVVLLITDETYEEFSQILRQGVDIEYSYYSASGERYVVYERTPIHRET